VAKPSRGQQTDRIKSTRGGRSRPRPAKQPRTVRNSGRAIIETATIRTKCWKRFLPPHQRKAEGLRLAQGAPNAADRSRADCRPWHSRPTTRRIFCCWSTNDRRIPICCRALFPLTRRRLPRHPHRLMSASDPPAPNFSGLHFRSPDPSTS